MYPPVTWEPLEIHPFPIGNTSSLKFVGCSSQLSSFTGRGPGDLPADAIVRFNPLVLEFDRIRIPKDRGEKI